MDRDNILVKALEVYGTKLHHRGQWRVHAWLRNVLHVSLDEELEVSRSGLRWSLNPSNYVESDLFWLGSKDDWEIQHARRFLPPKSIIFDIGANFGYYSCKFASILKRNCVIYAFEPLPSNYQRLTKNICLNDLQGCVHPFEMGLSDSERRVSMISDARNTGAAYVTGDDGDIALTTLDGFCDKQRIQRVEFVKIDVEGFEPFVLRGGKNIIRNSKPVILIEINPVTLARRGFTPRDVTVMLEDFGYCMFIPIRERLEKVETLPDIENYLDIFCVHPDRIINALDNPA